MQLFPIICLVLATACVVGCAWALVWAAPRIEFTTASDVCLQCEYSLKGLADQERCPECGTHRSTMKLHREANLASTLQRLALVVFPSAVTAAVVTLGYPTMETTGNGEAVVPIIVIGAFPFFVPAFATLVAARVRDKAWVLSVLLAATVMYNVLIGVPLSPFWIGYSDGWGMVWMSFAASVVLALASLFWLVIRLLRYRRGYWFA